jgi:hypothetical protein
MKYFCPLFILSLSAFLFSCHSNSSNEINELSRLNDSTSVTGLTGDAVKLVRTASVNFKVKDVEQSTRAVWGLAHKYGGMIYYQNFQSVEGGRKERSISTDSLLVVTTATPQAEITVRIPSENLEAFLFGVADLGYYTANSQLKIDDKSLSYLENELKQKNRSAVLSHLDNKIDSTLLKTIEVNDQGIEQLITNKAIDADANYSTVNLNLFQNALVRKETIANYVTGDYQLPFSHRLSNAMNEGWQFFLGFIIALVHLWIFILLALAAFISYRFWQQKKNLAN